MTVTHVLAVALVSDQDSAVDWYQRLFGRGPDARPMPSLADWHLADSAWVQVFHDPDRAGRSVFNLVVDDLDRHRAALEAAGIAVADVVTNAKGTRLAALTDPDGNTITLIENPVTD